jgi:hypothetical protein
MSWTASTTEEWRPPGHGLLLKHVRGVVKTRGKSY